MYLLTNTKYINDEAYLKLITRLNKKKRFMNLELYLKLLVYKEYKKLKTNDLSSRNLLKIYYKYLYKVSINYFFFLN